MYGSIHGFFIQIFISFSRYSSYSRYSLSYLCGNKSNHQTQIGGNTDGNAESGSLCKPSDNRWSYQETEETDARNDGDGNACLNSSQLSRNAVTNRHRRRNAKTYQQEAQSGRNQIRQGSSQPQTFNTLAGPYFVTNPSAMNLPNVIAPIPAT